MADTTQVEFPMRGYWQESFKTLYQCYFQEFASEALIVRWQWTDIVTSVLVALTASGSAVAGWALWSQPGGKAVWAVVAGIASVASILHGAMQVPGRVKEQEEVRRAFSELRVDLETLRQDMSLGSEVDPIRSRYTKLRERFAQCIGRTRPEIAFGTGLRKQITQRVNKELQDYIQG